MLTLKELKEILKARSLRPLKRLGENYLIDANIKDKVIAEVRPRKDDTIVEIGPGFGALTFDLAGSGAAVYAVEKDRKVFSVLKEMAGDDFSNLKLICGDILKFDIGRIVSQGKIKVVGNLPYYITTPIIEYLIMNKSSVGSAVVTIQREVANRLLASAGTKDYGAISCFVQYHMKTSYVHTVKRTSFYPAPEVDSSIIRLDMLASPPIDVGDEALLFRIIRGSFNQRRKAIINSLSRKTVLDLPKEILSQVLIESGIDPNARPEGLRLSDFAKIASRIKGRFHF